MSNKILNDEQRLNLQKMIQANSSEDYTEHIKNSKHSQLIKTDVANLLFIKKKYNDLLTTNPDEFDNKCVSECQFLFNNYTDIFNKVKKDLIDLNILGHFLEILKKIEDGNIDQHEGSYLVGELLKKIYIDSALRREQKIDNEQKSNKKKSRKKLNDPKNISYKQYKTLIENKNN
jgi:hypothetical protein